MQKYLLSKRQKIIIGTVGLIYIIYQLVKTELYSISIDSSFQSYLATAYISSLLIALLLMKRKDWKSKIKLLTLAALLAFIFYTTSTQLNSMYDGFGVLADENLNYEQLQVINPYINFVTYYRLGKIAFFDIFAIFAFFGIFKTVNDIKISEE